MFEKKAKQMALLLDEKGGIKRLLNANGFAVEFSSDELCLFTDFGRFSTAEAENVEIVQEEDSLTLHYTMALHKRMAFSRRKVVARCGK